MYKMLLKAVVLVFTLQISCSNPVFRQCSLSKPCHPGEYCYQERFCHECYNCETHGLAGTGGCARERKDCGECLPGYIPDKSNEFHDGLIRFCIKDNATTIIETTTMKDNSLSNSSDANPSFWIWFSSGVLLVAVLVAIALLLVFFVYKCKKNSRSDVEYPEKSRIALPTAPTSSAEPLNPRRHHHNIDLRPPPYYMHSNLAYEETQRARPFTTPSSYISPADVPDNTDSGPPIPNQSNLPEDENTQPSPWRPSPVSNGERTNFSGILSENSSGPICSDSNRTSDEPPSKQAKTDSGPTVNLYISTSMMQANVFSEHVNIPGAAFQRDPTSTRPSRNQNAHDNPSNDELVPENRNEHILRRLNSNEDYDVEE